MITTLTTNAKEQAKALGIPIYYDDLRPGLRGVYLPQNKCIFLQPDQHPHMENWILWHEIGHFHTSSMHLKSKAEKNSIERTCDTYAARSLLPINHLCDPTLYSEDFAQWAYNLRVPPRALCTRLKNLSYTESDALNHPLRGHTL